MERWAEILTISIAAISVMGTSVWRLAVLQSSLLAKIQSIKDDIDQVIDDERVKVSSEFDRLRGEVRENMTAIRQKITEVEIWGRDNYVKQDTFTQVVARFERSLETFDTKIDNRFNRVEEKLDDLNAKKTE